MTRAVVVRLADRDCSATISVLPRSRSTRDLLAAAAGRRRTPASAAPTTSP
ncbi:MAG: hypothetical protein MZW92_15575 [Comamonadaceae bacterium]|nr:hypothetical protein [Comamonadaceae bacterium]